MRRKRLTFEYTRGWYDHMAGVAYNSDETEDWRIGWIGRETYTQSLKKRLAAE